MIKRIQFESGTPELLISGGITSALNKARMDYHWHRYIGVPNANKSCVSAAKSVAMSLLNKARAKLRQEAENYAKSQGLPCKKRAPRYKPSIETTVCGIPCGVARVSDDEIFLVDRNGYHMRWLERKAGMSEMMRVDEELESFEREQAADDFVARHF